MRYVPLVFGWVLITLCLMALPLIRANAHAAKPTPGLQAVNVTPLGQRIPLVLLHGINPNPATNYGWQGFIRQTAADAAFQSHYKSYLFVYNPALSISENGRALHAALLDYRQQHPEAPPFRFAALSLGGLVLRDALSDETLWQHTDRIVAISVPFHGSPLANRAWIRDSLKKASLLNPLRRFERIAYAVTRRKFPHFAQDFCWDNFDGNMPEALARQQNCPSPTGTHSAHEENAKYIFYGGFFNAAPKDRQWLQARLDLSNAESKPVQAHIPRFSRHAMFSLVQPCLANLSLQAGPTSEAPSVTAFNDGISPISSQLWLGRFIHATRDGQPIPPQAQWQTVAGFQNHSRARLFDGLDHRDWLEGQTRYAGSEGLLQDWLNPGEPTRNIFQWIARDLMRD